MVSTSFQKGNPRSAMTNVLVCRTMLSNELILGFRIPDFSMQRNLPGSFQLNFNHALLRKANDRHALAPTGRDLHRIPHQVLDLLDRLAIDNPDHIASKKPGFARFAMPGTLERITPDSPGVPAVDNSSSLLILRALAPTRRTTCRLRLLLNAPTPALCVEGSSGSLAMAGRSPRFMDARSYLASHSMARLPVRSPLSCRSKPGPQVEAE